MTMDRLTRQLTNALRRQLNGDRANVPEAGRLAWGWFADLCGTRTPGQPISYAEIEAYARLHRWPLEPRHVQLIRDLDRVWLVHARQATHAPQERVKAVPRSSGTEINAAVFDAVFG